MTVVGVMLSFSTIQHAIERCITADPPHGLERRLSKDASMLAEILGEMIYRKVETISIETFTAAHQEAYRRWAPWPRELSSNPGTNHENTTTDHTGQKSDV